MSAGAPHTRLVFVDVKGRYNIVCDEARRDRAVVHCSYGYGLVLQTAGQRMTVSKGQGDARIGCTAVDKRKSMYGFLVRETGRDRNEKNVRMNEGQHEHETRVETWGRQQVWVSTCRH